MGKSVCGWEGWVNIVEQESLCKVRLLGNSSVLGACKLGISFCFVVSFGLLSYREG